MTSVHDSKSPEAPANASPASGRATHQIKANARAEFDRWAHSYDRSIVQHLLFQPTYRMFMEELYRWRRNDGAPFDLLDIGCGTGLAGTLLRPWAARLDGFDLSPQMVAEARRNNIYDAVAVADLLDLPQGDAPRYGLAVAVDVLCYVGDLAPAFAAIRARLIGRGHLAFTVEAGSGFPYALGPAQRFRHDPHAIERWLADADFERLACERAVLRRERREPVDGLVVVARLKH